MTSPSDPTADTPPGPGIDVPWAGWRAVVDVVVIYVAALLLAGVPVVVFTALSEAPGDLPLTVLLLASPVALLLVTIVWLRVRYAGHAVLAAGRRRWRWSDVGLGVGLGLACFVGQQLLLAGLVAVLTRLGLEAPPVQQTFRVIADNPSTAPALAVTAVVLAPAAEELLFRGVLFQGVRARAGFWTAALASAAMFTLAHLGDASGLLADVIIVIGILPLGVVFAAIMERRGSLLTPAVTHGVYNAGGVALLLLGAPGA